MVHEKAINLCLVIAGHEMACETCVFKLHGCCRYNEKKHELCFKFSSILADHGKSAELAIMK